MSSSSSEEVKIISFKLELHLGATVSINGNEAWVKPSAIAGMTWSAIPSSDQMKAALDFLSNEILNPTLKEVMDLVTENTKVAKGIK